MALLTTTIGAYPKPAYVPIPDRFRHKEMSSADRAKAYRKIWRTQAETIEATLDRATRQVVREQVRIGIDLPTDGEVRRDHSIYYHCRHLDGFDFSRFSPKVMRDGTWEDEVPTLTGPIEPRRRFLPRDWRIAQAVTGNPLKITIPGPMTIIDSVVDDYYYDEKRLGAALAEALNVEIRALAEAGCAWIQIDEPLFARAPEKAVAFGIDRLEHCFHRVPPEVTRVVHVCCGSPNELDREDYPKADQKAYFELAEAIELSRLQAISIEDAHRPNDLKLLERFARTTVVLGVIDIARSRVETSEEITVRLNQALQHIDARRLIAASDCGLGLLDRRLVLDKLTNMVIAARAVG